MAITIESNNVDMSIYTSPMGLHIFREGDGSGDLWSIYCRGGNVYLRKSTDNGSTWESAIVGYTHITANDYAVESALVYDSGNSKVYAVYHTRPEEKIYARSFNVTTEVWNADQTELTGLSIPIWDLAIDRDTSGRLWIGYSTYKMFDTTTPTCSYYIRRSTNVNDITAWGNDVTIGNSGSFDGFGQLRINCHKVTDDKVLAIYFKYTGATTYTLQFRVNDGLGDGAGNWAAEANTNATVYGATLNNPLTETHWRDYRNKPTFYTVRWNDGNIYLITASTTTIYCRLYDWSSWTAKDSGIITSYVGGGLCACGGFVDDAIRAFLGYATTIGYTTYAVTGNAWNDTTTTLEAESPLILTCTEGFSTLNDNRLLYQTVFDYSL